MKSEPMAAAPPEEEDIVFGGFNQLTKSLDDADDRGLILALSAFAEDALGDLLSAFMLPCEASTQLISGFNAPLGTFSSRIKAAYALGLVTKEQFQDLERLRKIRNEFAHTWKPIDLSHPKARAAAEAMNFSGIDRSFPKTPSKRVQSSISCLLIELRVATNQIKKHGGGAKLQGRHLMSGFVGNTFLDLISCAREEFESIKVGLVNPDADERAFFKKQLARFSDRLALIKPTTPEEKIVFIEFLSEVRAESATLKA